MLYASPEECERAFYDALAHGDIEAMADLWLQDDDICCTHPGSQRLVGYQAVRASWAGILAAGGPGVRPLSRHCFESPTLTVSHLVEEVIVEDEHGSRVVHVLATNAFSKTPAGWKMIMHFGAVAPLGHAVDVQAPGGTVH